MPACGPGCTRKACTPDRTSWDELDARFDCQAVACGPYFFADLTGTGDSDEQAAIDSGLIQANRIQCAGRRKSPPPAP
jgi:hypothetical protein